jgi:kynurenine formamidase
MSASLEELITVMTDSRPPSYDELPELGNLGVRHSWDVLPQSLGTLALLDEGTAQAGARSVISGKSFGLSLPLDTFDPPLFGRKALGHSVFEASRNTYEDTVDSYNPQSASQWDGLGHIRARELGFYGGITDDEAARSELGIHHWATRGIVGRGVLLDVERYLVETGEAWDAFGGDTIGVDVLEATAAAQDLTLARGDILCVRIGWTAEYRRRKAAGEDMSSTGDRFSGLSAAEPMARFLWNTGFSAVCSDNPAIESAPGNREDGSLHRRLIPSLGFALSELLDLDDLAAACAEEQRWNFMFAAAPLPVVGAVSSPANAVAVL